METSYTSKTLLCYQTVRRHIPEDRNIDNHIFIQKISSFVRPSVLSSHLYRKTINGKMPSFRFQLDQERFIVTKSWSLHR
jgi:hypothetical protein